MGCGLGGFLGNEGLDTRFYGEIRGKNLRERAELEVDPPFARKKAKDGAHASRQSVVVYKLQNGAKPMAKKKLTNYDPAEDLGSDGAIAIFMAEAFETNDVGYISHALGVVARAKGMAQIAEQTGLSREQLYRSFSEKGNPTLKTTLAVMQALGIELTAKIPSAA